MDNFSQIHKRSEVTGHTAAHTPGATDRQTQRIPVRPRTRFIVSGLGFRRPLFAMNNITSQPVDLPA